MKDAPMQHEKATVTRQGSDTDPVQGWLNRYSGGTDLSAGVQRCWQRFLTAAGNELDASGRFAPGEFPYVTEEGSWRTLDVEQRSKDSGESYDHGNWFPGFRAGIAWLHAAGSTIDQSRRIAERWTEQLATRANDTTTHDLGFLFHPAYALPGLLSGGFDVDHTPARTAARTLAARWNERTGLLQAFGPIGSSTLGGTSTIDTMMNLPLLWWASEQGEEAYLADVALRHARTSARLYLRPDGSTYHLLNLNPISGAVRHRGTFQGSGDDSCWSRGQAWAVCGFAWAYACFVEPELLDAADRTAAFFFDRLPESGIPPWDFTAAEQAPDSSASAVVALGCSFLAEVHPDQDRAAAYRAAGDSLLTVLGDRSVDAGRSDGILQHSTYSLPHRRGIDAATGFGDFYLGLAAACGTGAISVEALAGHSR